MVEFCAFAMLKFKGFGGEDAYAYAGANYNILDCGEALDEEDLKEFGIWHLFNFF